MQHQKLERRLVRLTYGKLGLNWRITLIVPTLVTAFMITHSQIIRARSVEGGPKLAKLPRSFSKLSLWSWDVSTQASQRMLSGNDVNAALRASSTAIGSNMLLIMVIRTPHTPPCL